MSTIWFTSDPHYYHENCFKKFKVKCVDCGGSGEVLDAPLDVLDGRAFRVPCGACVDGEVPMRPFTSVEEMNETMVSRWNEVVKPSDKAYILGDVCVRHRHASDYDIIKRLHGHKRLVLGNHDEENPDVYAKYFEKVHSSRLLDGIIFTHIPVHPGTLFGKTKANVHGHLHNNHHRLASELACPPYLNISVELTDYRPLSLEQIKSKLGL